MELPDSIKTLGEQVEAGSDIQPAAELFEAYPVFAADPVSARTSELLP